MNTSKILKMMFTENIFNKQNAYCENGIQVHFLIQFKRIEIFLICVKKIKIENSHDKVEKLFYEDKTYRETII